MQPRLLTLFPAAENIHLVKDVGMIPYILYKHFGYRSTIASFRNGGYPYLETEVSGLNQVFIRRYFNNNFADTLFFVFLNYRKYDIIQLYHLSRTSLLAAYLFKILTLRKGVTYIKMDAHDFYLNFTPYSVKWVTRYLVARTDIITAESKQLCRIMSRNWNRAIDYIPNGFYGRSRTDEQPEKVNTMLTVGRVGTRQKATGILCSAFAEFSKKRPGWKLEFIGPIAAPFQPFIDNYFSNHPELKNQVFFRGAIESRSRLAMSYAKAKIFVLTSRWEGSPLVFPEAQEGGCFILSSDLTAAKEIIEEGAMGMLFPVDDHKALAAIMEEAASKTESGELMVNIREFAWQHFYWPVICKRLHLRLGQISVLKT